MILKSAASEIMETVTTEETTNLESVVCFPSEAII